MNKANLTQTINQHAYTVDGVRSQFSVATVSREPLWCRPTRYLFAVKVRTDGARHEPVIHVLVGTGGPRDEVIRSLEHALQDQLDGRPGVELAGSPGVFAMRNVQHDTVHRASASQTIQSSATMTL